MSIKHHLNKYDKAMLKKPLYWILGVITAIIPSIIIGLINPKVYIVIFLSWVLGAFALSIYKSVVFIKTHREEPFQEGEEQSLRILELSIGCEIIMMIFIISGLIKQISMAIG